MYYDQMEFIPEIYIGWYYHLKSQLIHNINKIKEKKTPDHFGTSR